MKVWHYDDDHNWVEEEATLEIDGHPYESFGHYLLSDEYARWYWGEE